MKPLVTIGMPVRGCSSTILPAVKSIIRQTYTNWELLLIDDGSELPLERRLSGICDSRIRIIRHEQSRGLAARLNEAIGLAQGGLFARMDGDDICFPERLERQVEFLNDHRDVDLLGTRVVVFDSNGDVVGSLPSAETHELICSRPWRAFISMAHPTWMGRIGWFRKYLYDAKYKKSQDREILLRSFRESRFDCLPDYLLGYRQDNLNFSKIFWTRFYVGKAMWHQSLTQRDKRLLFGAGLQVAKLAWDGFALSSGLRYRMWKHRAQPVQDDVLKEWSQIWIEYAFERSNQVKIVAA